MDIKNEIIKTIEILIDKRIPKGFQDIPTVILGQQGNKYKVKIDGVEHWVKDGVQLHPAIGKSVWIHLPNGKLTDAYIAALR